MATEYTTSKPEIVFLNDKCIAQKGADIDTIDYNAIPSLSLFNNVENALVEKDAALELSVNEISGTVKSNINDVDVLNKHVKSTYAVFNNFDFEYSRDRHSIELTLKNSSATAISDTTMLSIDTTDFIRDRVISTILVKGDDLWIYWNEHDYIAVRLSSLA